MDEKGLTSRGSFLNLSSSDFNSATPQCYPILEDDRCLTLMFVLSFRSGYEYNIEGTAVLDDPSKDEGKLTVTFNIAGESSVISELAEINSSWVSCSLSFKSFSPSNWQ